MTKLRIMTWNIQGGRSNTYQPVIDQQARFIKGQAPDVVMLQEVGVASSATAGVEQIEVLSQLSGLPHYSFWDATGIGLLSRYPLTDVAKELAPRPWYNYLPTSWQGPRGVLLTSALVDGRPYRFISTHVSHRGGQYADSHTGLLAQLVHQIPPSVWPVLGGDFNMSLTEPALNDLRKWMDLAEASEPPVEKDQIWVGKFVPHQVLSGGQVDGGGLSDHDPVVAVLDRTAPLPPVGRLKTHCAPSPLPIPARHTAGTAMGTVQASVTATDAASGAQRAGTVRLNATALGRATLVAGTGQVIAVPYRITVTVDPLTHEHETTVELPNGTVSVPGYHDEPVNWDN